MGNRQQGFTLIETVVSMVIAGIILGVIYYAFSMSMRITNSGNDILLATDIAKTVFADFMKNKKDKIEFLDEFEEKGEYDKTWSYDIKISNLSVNLNDKVDVDVDKGYKLSLMIKNNQKGYNFDFYFQK